MNSLDGPVCIHQWNLFNPNPCPQCEKERQIDPELATTLSRLETLAEEEAERLQALLDTEEEKDETNDEKIEKLSNQINALEEIINQINIYEQTRDK